MLARQSVQWRLALIAASAAVSACAPDSLTAPRLTPSRAAPVIAATVTVTNINDAGAGSLRDAIANAVNGDVIGFDASIAGQVISLTSGELTISGKSITIVGPETGGITISGGNSHRVLRINADAGMALMNTTAANGYAPGTKGGAIWNDGTLLLQNSTVTANYSGPSAGGGIYSTGTLTVVNSTISGNNGAGGGGIHTSGSAEIVSSTVTANTGAGIGVGGGTLTLRNSIIAGNPEGALVTNCIHGGTFVYAGVNLSDNSTCGVASTSMIVADPQLGTLADNGGPTRTHNLGATSPAIDAGSSCTVTEDQRYVARPQGAACDIGAVEFNDYLLLGFTIDASAVVNPVTGVALVSGTLTCSAPLAVTIHVTLNQPQKAGRVHTVVSAAGDVAVDCASSGPWGIALAPATGAFQNGTGTVSAQTVNTTPSVVPAAATRSVKMVWGHK
jgi:hypothetical protein